MLKPVEGVPLFARRTRTEAVLDACDGRAAHVPFPATLDGIQACAREMAGVDFPRGKVAALLEDYSRGMGAPPAALDNASRIGAPNALVVTTGQQPVAFGGPLYVLYKAATAVGLAQKAEAALGVPVVPVFWNASEDHDLDEVARAAAPGRGGEALRYRADLSAWRGCAASAIGPDDGWRTSACEWAASVSDEMTAFAPREDERWARWSSRLLLDAFGSEGLVMMEPRLLRSLSGAVYAGAIRGRDEVARLVSLGGDERPGEAGARQFDPLGGPPLFMERDGRRLRVVESGDRLALKGTDVTYSPDELAALAEREPERFSSHAALRPVLQNTILPVVAAVLGPGEIAYHEELFRLHASATGARRRMPVMWPRLSATVLDRRAESTMARFGLAAADVFLKESELVRRFTPMGDVARRIAEAGRAAADALRALGEDATALDATLAKPLAKTLGGVERAFETFASKTGAAEARAVDFAPEKLHRLAASVSPGGRPQERVFSWAWAIARFGPHLASALIGALDLDSRRHQILLAEEEGAHSGC